MGEAKNIAGEWGVDKSHGGEQKIRGGGLSRGVLLRGVLLKDKRAEIQIFCHISMLHSRNSFQGNVSVAIGSWLERK